MARWNPENLAHADRSPVTEDTYDPVEKPAHYTLGGVECIDYIEQVLGLDGFIAYCHGNMVKYQHRYRHKNEPAEDMKKAEWYLRKMNKALGKKYQ
jgi:hypothetical protein